MILRVREIDTYYGHSHVLQGVSLDVKKGQVVGLLGRNGVGKTTTLRSIMGLVPPSKGEILLGETNIARRMAYEIARMGIAYVPDDRRIFADLTTFENMEIARRTSGRRDGPWTYQKIFGLFPILETYLGRKGNQLSGGEQKMLAIARGLITNPLLLLLDEPSEGLAPLVVRNLAEVTLKIREEGVTVLLADQNFKFCRQVADTGYILEKGRVQYHAPMAEIWNNEEVVRRFLVI
ncbi:MAG: ABC transporter ATP-binding protein [Thermodesulfobacteriota bacterium]